MQYKLILEAGLTIEAVKQTSVSIYWKTARKVNTWLTEWEEKHPKSPEPCTGNFLCLNETSRHKHSCPHSSKYTCSCWQCKGEREPVIQGTW